METLKSLWDAISTEAIAGISGAVAISLVEWHGWVRFARQVVVGGICAVYMSDLSVPLLEFFLSGLKVGSHKAPELGGFIMGMAGMVIVEFFIKLFKKAEPISKKRNRDYTERDYTEYDDYEGGND